MNTRTMTRAIALIGTLLLSPPSANAWPTDRVELGWWDTSLPYRIPPPGAPDGAALDPFHAVNGINSFVAYAPNLPGTTAEDMDTITTSVTTYLQGLRDASPNYRPFAEIPRRFFFSATEGSTEAWTLIDEYIRAVEPFVFGWFLIDEPDQPERAWATPARVEELVEEHIRAFSEKPTMIVFSPLLDPDIQASGEPPVPVQDYLPWVNYVGLDFFTVQWGNGPFASWLSQPVEAVQILKDEVVEWEVANPTEPERIIFYVAQGFGRDPGRLIEVFESANQESVASTSGSGYPTFAESRYAAWMPIINGFHAVYWYSHWFDPNERDFTIGPVAREISGYATVLRSTEATSVSVDVAEPVNPDVTTPALTIDGIELQRRDGSWVEVYDPSSPVTIGVPPGSAETPLQIDESNPDFEPFDFLLSDRAVRFRLSKNASSVNVRLFFHREDLGDVPDPPVWFEFSEFWADAGPFWLGKSIPWNGTLIEREVLIDTQGPTKGQRAGSLVDVEGRSLQGPIDRIEVWASEAKGYERPSFSGSPGSYYSEVNFGIQVMTRADPDDPLVSYVFACNSSPFPIEDPVRLGNLTANDVTVRLEQDARVQGESAVVINPGSLENIIDQMLPYEVCIWRVEETP